MDSLKLNVVAVDEIHPQLSDLIQALNKSVADTNGKKKIRDWLITLNQMKASDELNPEQVRQLLFDLERYVMFDIVHMPNFSIH
jgi:ESCRT-I complex subunit VPS28